MRGRLEGINSAIYSQSGGSVGIGFAIPVDMVRVVLAAAKAGRPMHRPWLGASLQGVTKDIADSFGLDRPGGVLVTEVVPKSPAAEAGLKRGDLVAAIDGQAVDDPESLGYRLADEVPRRHRRRRRAARRQAGILVLEARRRARAAGART